LEYRVGTSLFLRSVSGVSVTAAGERLVEPAKKMAEWAGEATRAAGAEDRSPRGLVRVTAPPFVCAELLAPFAAQLARREPKLQLEVVSVMHYLDLARGEADLALRGVSPTQPELTTVASVTVPTGVFVSRALAARLPRKPSPAQLPWVGWSPPWDSLPPGPQLAAAIPGYRPAFTSDNFLVQVAAAQAGVGAIILARHHFATERGLVPVAFDLGAWSHVQLHLVCAKSALDIPRVRTVAQLLAAALLPPPRQRAASR
jgi:DNA-binding transcriptional LysR family regulator